MRKCRAAVNRKRRTVIIVLVVILLAVFCCVIYLRGKVVPIIKSVSEERVRALTVSAVNESVLEVFGCGTSELVQTTYDANGDICLIQLKSSTINSLVQKTTLRAQEKLSALGNSGIQIPLGTLTGMVTFTGKGPLVDIKVLPVGSILSSYDSSFTSAGINQTVHRVYLRLDTATSVVFPGANNRINTLTEVMIHESVLVGKIPEVYLNSNNLDNMLDLIP